MFIVSNTVVLKFSEKPLELSSEHEKRIPTKIKTIVIFHFHSFKFQITSITQSKDNTLPLPKFYFIKIL